MSGVDQPAVWLLCPNGWYWRVWNPTGSTLLESTKTNIVSWRRFDTVAHETKRHPSFAKQKQNSRHSIYGPSWRLQPIWKKIAKMGIFANLRDENNKSLKPPPRWSIYPHEKLLDYPVLLVNFDQSNCECLGLDVSAVVKNDTLQLSCGKTSKTWSFLKMHYLSQRIHVGNLSSFWVVSLLSWITLTPALTSTH